MALSTEQLLLLNNLIYGWNENAVSEGQTVADLVNSIDLSQVKGNGDFGCYITGKDWRNLINSIKNDGELMKLTIASIHTDNAQGGGGGKSAVFLNKSAGEAAVVFKGTEGGKEWEDNFAGGTLTDTAQQKNALEWYREIYKDYGLDQYDVTVTGHSKGGNKAKYITVLDSSVDRCVSFDGQGFSDQFMSKYKNEIAERQCKIENHNIDYDYVNFLLNDIGETTFYEGHDYGEGGFLENHSPVTFFDFDETGRYTLTVNPAGQAVEIKALDEFANKLLRSMPEKERGEVLELLDPLREMLVSSNQENKDNFIQKATSPQYLDNTLYILAYAATYIQMNPEFAKQLCSLINKVVGMGWGTAEKNVIEFLMNIKRVVENIENIMLPLGVYKAYKSAMAEIGNLLLKTLAQYEKQFNSNQMEKLQDIVAIVNGKDIQVRQNGEVAVFNEANADASLGGCIWAKPGEMQMISSDLKSVAERLLQLGSDVGAETKSINDSFTDRYQFCRALMTNRESLSRLGTKLSQASKTLEQIAGFYSRTENSLLNRAGVY